MPDEKKPAWKIRQEQAKPRTEAEHNAYWGDDDLYFEVVDGKHYADTPEDQAEARRVMATLKDR